MTVALRNRFFMVVLAFVCALGLALAQSSAQTEVAAQGSASTDSTVVPVQRRAALSPAEQAAEAERIQTQGTRLSQRLLSMLDEARREADIMRTTCIDRTLAQVNAHNATLETRVRDLANATDDARRNHEFTVISVIGHDLNSLDRDANECVGQDMFNTSGVTRITTTVDPRAPTENAAALPVVPVTTITTANTLPPPSSL